MWMRTVCGIVVCGFLVLHAAADTYAELLTPHTASPMVVAALPELTRWAEYRAGVQTSAGATQAATPAETRCLLAMIDYGNHTGACSVLGPAQGKNLLCEAECGRKMTAPPYNCTKKTVGAFCNNDFQCFPTKQGVACEVFNNLSPACDSKMRSLLQQITTMMPHHETDDRRQLRGGEGKGRKGHGHMSTDIRDAYQSFSSWSVHFGEQGHYYQCNSLDGYYFWQAHFNCNVGEKSPFPANCYQGK